MKNLWIEQDEPRKHFFKVAYPLLSNVAFLSRVGRMDDLYAMYEAFVSAYKKLDVLLRLYDKDVINVFEGVEVALSIYVNGDVNLNRIFAEA